MKKLYQKWIVTKSNLVKLIIVLALFSIWIFMGAFVGKNDPMHFIVIEHIAAKNDAGRLTVEKKPGHFMKWFNKTHKWEWANSVWFSQYEKEGADKDESVDTRYNDGAIGATSGIMVYNFKENTPDSIMTMLQADFRNQENFEDRVIFPMNQDALKLSSALMSSEESYTTKKKEYGFIALDQLQNGIYKTEVIRDTITDFTGETVIADVTKIKKSADDNPLRNTDKTLAQYYLEIPIYSLYEPVYKNAALNTTIEKKRKASMDKIISLAKTKLEKRLGHLEDVKGQVNVLTKEYEQKALNTVQIIAAETNKDTIRIKSETHRVVASVRKKISLMKKKIGELNGGKELEVRKLLIGADNQLVSRLDSYERVQKLQAEAFGKATNVMPGTLLGGEGGNSAQTAWDMFLINQAQSFIKQPKTTPGQPGQ